MEDVDKNDQSVEPAVDNRVGSPPRDFMAAPAAVDINELSAQLQVSQRIGRYKLLEQIGEGGFGVVFMAEQLEPIQRRVALKIIKAGMDTKQVIARFEAERQALALMDHPNIAKVHDAGTTETGRPYFVMELVRGDPVTDYCDDRNLSKDERLRLFMEICSAIQHAHQKGIIHRDIKPNNILVATNGDQPVPKVIDFGIAKATQSRLTDKTLFTNFRQFIGTPAYMSPEQAQMSAVDVDTRSDVYSLGVLLYELLTGHTPLDSKELMGAGFEEVCRRIREEEVPKPSNRISSLRQVELTTLARQRRIAPAQFMSSVRGDLDWIVMKAVEKDRSRRYDSCGALASDIDRFLSDEPVLAGPPTAIYHLRKFIRRNRTAALTTLAIGVSLVVGTAMATMSWMKATDAQSDLAKQLQATKAETERAVSAENNTNAALATAEIEGKRAINAAYLADMQAGHQAIRSNNLGLAKRILDRNRNFDPKHDPRHWEWRALWRLCQGNAEKTFGLDGKSASSLSISADGRWVAAGGNGDVRVWDSFTGKLHATLLDGDVDEGQVVLSPSGKRESLQLPATGLAFAFKLPRVAFSPNGNHLFAAARDGSIKSWRVPDFLEPENVGSHGSQVMSMAVSPDSKRLVALGNVGPPPASIDVTVWDLETPKLKKRIDCGASGGEGAVAISADGSKFGIGLNDGLRILDLPTLNTLQVIEKVSSRRTVAFSPDGQWVASATGLSSPGINVHRVVDGERVARIVKHTDGIRALAFSPDGWLLASASSDQTVRLWHTNGFAEVAMFRGHVNEVMSLSFSADGKRLITGGKAGEICVWNIESGQVANWPTTAQRVVTYGYWYRQHSQVSYSPDGNLLATTRFQDEDKRWSGFTLRSPEDLETVQIILDTGEVQRGLRFSPVDNLIAVGDVNGSLAFVDPQNPNEVQRLVVEKEAEVFPSRFTPDGKRLLVVARGNDKTVCVVYSIDDRNEVARWTVPQSDNCATVSPSGEMVATGHEDGIRIWSVNDASGGTTRIPIRSTRGIDFSPDGRFLVAGTGDGLIEIIDVESRTVERKLAGHIQHIGDVKFSPDAKRLASAGTKNDALKVWDFESGRELVTFEAAVGFGFSNRQVEWSPDGDGRNRSSAPQTRNKRRAGGRGSCRAERWVAWRGPNHGSAGASPSRFCGAGA